MSANESDPDGTTDPVADGATEAALDEQPATARTARKAISRRMVAARPRRPTTDGRRGRREALRRRRRSRRVVARCTRAPGRAGAAHVRAVPAGHRAAVVLA